MHGKLCPLAELLWGESPYLASYACVRLEVHEIEIRYLMEETGAVIKDSLPIKTKRPPTCLPVLPPTLATQPLPDPQKKVPSRNQGF